MEETIKIINELEGKGRVRKYAIGGVVAAIFYVGKEKGGRIIFHRNKSI